MHRMCWITCGQEEAHRQETHQDVCWPEWTRWEILKLLQNSIGAISQNEGKALARAHSPGQFLFKAAINLALKRGNGLIFDRWD